MPTEHDLADFSFTVDDEDSPDLTDDEIATALPILVVNELGEHVSKCPTCERPSVKFHYARRRRKPSIFWRITTHCDSGHEHVRVFRIDFL